jgi:hypothetical protein
VALQNCKKRTALTFFAFSFFFKKRLRKNKNYLTGITTFNDLNSSSPEEMLLGHLDTIELHHGSYLASGGVRNG